MHLMLILAVAFLPWRNHAFTFPNAYCTLRSLGSTSTTFRFTSHKQFFSRESQAVIENDDDLLQSIRSLRAKEIKTQLEALNISTANAFEKEELVQRLYRARTSGVENANVNAKKKKKRRRADNDSAVFDELNWVQPANESSKQSTSVTSPNLDANADTTLPFDTEATITVPLEYYTLDSVNKVSARNSQDIYIRPSPGKFAAVRVKLQSKTTLAEAEYTLLVDTACSGIVLSPKAVSRSNGIIRTVKSGASMTTAGAVRQGGYDVATWGDGSTTKFIVGGVDVNEIDGSSGSMISMAAVNDIGALPEGLDGILGLSFLSKFECVDFDFGNNELRLYKTAPSPSVQMSEVTTVVAEGSLEMTKLGIYTIDTMLDGRGPVKLLIDTGAASTLLNWRGVSDLGFTSSSEKIELIRDEIGAMGADNTALRLTHRYVLKRRWNIQGKNPGIVLDALNSDGAGGILGADLLMMCDIVRFYGLNGHLPCVFMMKS
eukprot:CCRYP_019284-RA/>CCRYP_019284-RA protein AED:0.05 eAED:0.05 QI:121/1/1/1/0.5/0.33/3/115/488